MALKPERLLAPIVIAAMVVAIAWAFAAVVLAHTHEMGLPIDDSYIYLTYAKQFGRGEPFTYFPGGGYSAGSTSVLWPMVLAPAWTLGARGHALVWVSYVVCAVLYVLTALGVWRIVKRLGAGDVAGVAAVIALLGIAPMAWTALSGMEVAFASALLVAMILLLLDQPADAAPSKRLGVCLAATSLSRPEAMLIVAGVIGVAVIARARQRHWRAAAWWAVPLAAPIAWLVANRVFAGQLFPNTGVAKSYFYLPGFDWTYWWEAVTTALGRLVRGVFWDDGGPIAWPRAFAVLWLAGAVRVLVWARRERKLLAGLVIVGAPLALMVAVVASSGLWSFHNYRYIAPAFPLLAICAGVALAPLRRDGRFDLAIVLGGIAVVALVLALAEVTVMPLVMWSYALAPFALLLPLRWVRLFELALALGLYVHAAVPNLAADARLFAQGAVDTNTQVVAIGRYLHDKLPDANVMFHDAGAIAYYGDTRVYDMLGLVTNHQAGIANHGAGARFEFLERLPPELRPTHFAYYPSWLGNGEFYGDVLLQTPLQPRIKGLTKSPLVGDADMEVIVASFDHVGTGERPLVAQPGWHVVDRVDIADLESERGHDWHGTLGRRATGDPTAHWSLIGRESGARGLVVDGGRTIRGETFELAVTARGVELRTSGEDFTLAVDPTKPTRLVLRTGGAPQVPYHESITKPVMLRIDSDGHEVARAQLPAPTGAFVEVTFALPPGVTRVRTAAATPYRAFHWFALQPD